MNNYMSANNYDTLKHNHPHPINLQPFKYNFDMKNPHAYYQGKYNASSNSTTGYTVSTASSHSMQNGPHAPVEHFKPKWYENYEFQNKLVYRYEKSIPQVVQKVLEQMGFIEWDEDEHNEDQWNILWKSQR